MDMRICQCGYANAQGGTLIIGKNDDGDLTGISNAKKLLEDIPNKIVFTMNIIADVNLMEENGLEYIEIIVDSYPFNPFSKCVVSMK